MPIGRPSWFMALVLGIGLTVVFPERAAAHFVLHSPESWRVQGPFGDPQKTGPCGDEGTAALTGAVTAFAPGDTVTITLDEPIFHPGHYRVALAVNDRSELPAAPPVTPGATDCGTVPIMSPAVFPVLADGMLVHTEPFAETQSFQVTLPSDVTCTHCTLQVLEFMSNHGAPCFYHHCADISIGVTTGGCTLDADCDDGDACTTDRCDPEQVCVAEAITIADVADAVAGLIDAPACAADALPRAIGRLVGKADAMIARAMAEPAKATRLLKRAGKKLRRTGRKIEKASARGLSTECGAVLDAGVTSAQARIDCLLPGV